VSSEVLEKIRKEYLEMPGLILTTAQAGRLWSLDLPTCESLLDRLVGSHFLMRKADGRYARADFRFPVPRPIKTVSPQARPLPRLVSN
jgi:hypothetical protein